MAVAMLPAMLPWRVVAMALAVAATAVAVAMAVAAATVVMTVAVAVTLLRLQQGDATLATTPARGGDGSGSGGDDGGDGGGSGGSNDGSDGGDSEGGSSDGGDGGGGSGGGDSGGGCNDADAYCPAGARQVPRYYRRRALAEARASEEASVALGRRSMSCLGRALGGWQEAGRRGVATSSTGQYCSCVRRFAQVQRYQKRNYTAYDILYVIPF